MTPTAAISDATPRELSLRIEQLGAWGTAHERALWTVALGALVLDLVSTSYGLHLGLQEMNPIAAGLFDRFGYAALGALKGFSVAVAIVGWAVLPRKFRALVPACLALPWALAAISNSLLVAVVVVS